MSDNFISAFFISVITFLAGATGNNFLLAVVLFTFLIKMVLLPLDIKQRSSTRKMSKLQGKVAELQERYKNNPQQLQMKTRELYKKENVSMTAGCLPMLIQLPIIFAMFGAIRMLSNIETVKFVTDFASGAVTELNGFAWVHNIWQPDTATASVMPSLAEFSNVLSLCKDKLSPQVLQQVTTLLDNSSINQVASVAAILPEGSFFYNSMNTALNAVSPDAIAAAKLFNYNTVVDPIVSQYTGYGNGYYIFPVLAGAAMFGSSWITQRISRNTTAASAQSTNSMMLWMMPIMAIWMAASAAVPFSVYWISSSVFTMLSQVIMTMIERRRDAAETGMEKK